MYGMDDQRDYAEEAWQRHNMHTGDGELNYCNDEKCPSYVPRAQRDPQRMAQDKAFWEDSDAASVND